MVVLISHSGMDGWWRNTVLARPDVQVHDATDYHQGAKLLASLKRDLVVAEEWPKAAGFLDFVRKTAALPLCGREFKLLLLTPSLSLEEVGPSVFAVLPSPCNVDQANEALIAALGLTIRSGVRRQVRIYVSAGQAPNTAYGTAITLSVNAGGMVVESAQHLPAGRLFFWTFQGAPALEGLVIPGTVLRREGTPQLTRAFRYAVGFDPKAITEIERLKNYLAE